MRKIIVSFIVLLFGLGVAQAGAQQQTVVIGNGDTITVVIGTAFQDTLPVYQDTLPAIQDTLPAIQDTLPPFQDTIPVFQDTLPPIQLPPVQDTLPAIQDTLPAIQDTLPAVQDTLPAIQDTLPAYQDTLAAYQDTLPAYQDTIPGPPVPWECPEFWTCTPPVVPPDATLPGAVDGMTLVQLDTFIVVTWTDAEGADSYVVQGGENTSSWRFVEEGTFTGFSANMKPRASGIHWVCIFGQNPAGLSADGSCQNIVFTMPIPPPVVSSYLLSVSTIRNDMTGVQDVEEGDYYIHLNRPDGAWLGLGDISIPGVDSVVFVLDGFRNRERVYPYEATGGLIVGVPVGTHTVTWEVYGTEPDSGQATFQVTSIPVGPNTVNFSLRTPVPMEAGLMVQVLASVTPNDSVITESSMAGYVATLRGGPTTEAFIGEPLPDSLGWYWLPAPPDGNITITNGTDIWRATYIEVPTT